MDEKTDINVKELNIEKNEITNKNEPVKENIVKKEVSNNDEASSSTSNPNTTNPSLKRKAESSENPESKEASSSEENYMQYAKKTRKDNLMIKKEKSWTEFLLQLDDYTPIIPDVVTDYYLARAGFESDNVKLKRLLSLAAQKFIADIATDAFQHCKIRQQNSALKAKGGKDKRTVLVMDDLSTALQSYGINLKKPDYYM
ncbi:transcription initiation factor IID, TAF10 subunit [Neocallimastix lanati (nom. inval.)]|uniref:Transcription initiation factor TFIID subunit 10 n=1 Tax=Neocallimastix californiae TaxID=1754190 RepID=A0A1Y2ASM4_9FUNG|nr:transcription initiation factor IID, TAF10 subunit [Neocallimastix sp. JGI-2020a]ORY25300.1 transcription initiation factor IID, TAF10 subunit [Neocallimastix californiae]|eukprot:ORY25300.1 transcription initiation factor IID, TAF10 subunit [Neocallimastix californiae]